MCAAYYTVVPGTVVVPILGVQFESTGAALSTQLVVELYDALALGEVSLLEHQSEGNNWGQYSSTTARRGRTWMKTLHYKYQRKLRVSIASRGFREYY
jgi:hypothetical protein